MVVAISLKPYRSLPATVLAQKTVIDANNYYPECDGRIDSLVGKKITTSELVTGHLSESNVVKAFNAIIAKYIEEHGLPSHSILRRALPIAGDDIEAENTVVGLLDRFGFDVVDTGPLFEGWRFQAGTPAYCVRLDVAALKDALTAA